MVYYCRRSSTLPRFVGQYLSLDGFFFFLNAAVALNTDLWPLSASNKSPLTSHQQSVFTLGRLTVSHRPGEEAV